MIYRHSEGYRLRTGLNYSLRPFEVFLCAFGNWFGWSSEDGFLCYLNFSADHRVHRESDSPYPRCRRCEITVTDPKFPSYCIERVFKVGRGGWNYKSWKRADWRTL